MRLSLNFKEIIVVLKVQLQGEEEAVKVKSQIEERYIFFQQM